MVLYQLSYARLLEEDEQNSKFSPTVNVFLKNVIIFCTHQVHVQLYSAATTTKPQGARRIAYNTSITSASKLVGGKHCVPMHT